jgi:hypothetical protein
MKYPATIAAWLQRRALEYQKRHYLITACNLSDQISRDSQTLARVHRAQAAINSRLHALCK